MTEKRFTVDGDGITVIDNSIENVGEVYHLDGEYKGLYECKYSGEAKHLCDLLNSLSEENEQLQSEVSKLTDLLASEIEKNAKLLQEINSLKIENMRLKESIKDLNDILARYEEKELKE